MVMGYGTRRQSEYLHIFRKKPTTTKVTGRVHKIRDVYIAKLQQVEFNLHPHSKPKGLQKMLIESCTNKGDLVCDPAAGGFSVFECCKELERDFIGTNLKGL